MGKLYVREWRERRLLTQKEAAGRAGLALNTWNRIERGHTGRPHGLTLQAIAYVVGAVGGPIDLLAPPPGSRGGKRNGKR